MGERKKERKGRENGWEQGEKGENRQKSVLTIKEKDRVLSKKRLKDQFLK